MGKLAMWCLFSVPVFRWKMWCWSLTNTSSCMRVVCQLRQCVSIRTRYQNLMFKATVPQESLISSSPCKLHLAWLRLSHVCVDNEIIAIRLVFLRDLQAINYMSLWHKACLFFILFIDQRLVDLWVLLWPAHQAIPLRRCVKSLMSCVFNKN